MRGKKPPQKRGHCWDKIRVGRYSIKNIIIHSVNNILILLLMDKHIHSNSILRCAHELNGLYVAGKNEVNRVTKRDILKKFKKIRMEIGRKTAPTWYL